MVPGRQDDEHVQRAAVQQEEYGSRDALLLRWLLQAVLYLCSWPSARAQSSAPKRRFGGCSRDTATTEARSIDSDRFAESKSTAHQWVIPSDTSTGSVKSLRVLPTGKLAETTGTHRARCQGGNSMNNFCSPTTQRYRRYPPQRMCSSLTRLSTLDYAHVTAATAVEPAKSAVALSV